MNSSAELLNQVYDELCRLAHQRMAKEPAGHILQTTALVHEAYLRLAQRGEVTWNGRGHFFGAAARAMRRILVDWARQEHSQRRGGGQERVALGDLSGAYRHSAIDLIALDEALESLESVDPRKSQIVLLRYFAGLTVEETAASLGLSVATVHREWQFARAWLHGQVTGSTEEA